MKDDGTVTIRKYQAADEQQVRKLTIDSFDGVSIDQNFDNLVDWGRSPGWEERKWAASVEVLRDSSENSFVAESEGRVIGFVSCTVSPVTRVGRIQDLAVEQGYRRKGIGARLIERSLEHFQTKKMAIAKIETLEQNEAGRRLYPRFGFRQVANQVHYMMELEPGEEED